jgi:hypothetical protein
VFAGSTPIVASTSGEVVGSNSGISLGIVAGAVDTSVWDRYPPNIRHIANTLRYLARKVHSTERRPLFNAACAGDRDTRWLSDEEVSLYRQKMKDPPNDLMVVCGRCPVRQICLEDALIHRDVGIRGGTTYGQRESTRLLVKRGY